MTPSINDAERVRIRAVHGPSVFYETTSREEIASLEAALRTGAPLGAHCMCPGTILIDAERGDATTTITLHHGETLRWDGSPGNIPLVSPDAAMDWLSARGVTFVRAEWEAARQAADVAQAREERWRAAMPASMVPFHDPTGLYSQPSAECSAALERELPDPVTRARRMLELFGSGAGPWTGFPGYEQMPLHVLFAIPLETILAAIGDPTDPRIREGAARLFSDWRFATKRADDLARLPPSLRQVLLAHVEADTFEDKKERARSSLR